MVSCSLHRDNDALEPFLGVLRDGKSLDDYAFLVSSRTALLDRMVWWGNASKPRVRATRRQSRSRLE
jgi:hypothetical protein